MADSYSSLHYHFVFSTKNRERWITPDIEERIWAFIGGIAKENRMIPIQIGGIEDHIHILLAASPTHAPSKIAQLLKGGSSSWIHSTFPGMRGFNWQDGYAVFSVSKSSISEVTEYIKHQREHHRTRTFKEEYEAFLQRHNIAYKAEHLLG